MANEINSTGFSLMLPNVKIGMNFEATEFGGVVHGRARWCQQKLILLCGIGW